MGDTVLAALFRGVWRWWIGLGRQFHEGVVMQCILLVSGSMIVFRAGWIGLLGWTWGALGESKEQILTLGTAALAIVTYGLFARTAEMAAASREAVQAARDESTRSDRRHQQTLSGILTITNVNLSPTGQRAYNPGGGAWGPATGPWSQNLLIDGVIRNVGSGPALGAKLSVALPAVPYVTGLKPLNSEKYYGNVNASESMPIGPLVFSVDNLQRPLEARDMANATIRLEWKTIFTAEGWEESTVNPDGTRIFQRLNTPNYVP